MLHRILAGAIGGLTAANGLAMLLDGPGWYARVPGVTETGPYNPHFVADIGLAFVVAGAALAARAWRDSLWPAAATGAAYLVAHAGLHLAGIGDSHHASFEIALIAAPAALALWAALPSREKTA